MRNNNEKQFKKTNPLKEEGRKTKMPGENAPGTIAKGLIILPLRPREDACWYRRSARRRPPPDAQPSYQWSHAARE